MDELDFAVLEIESDANSFPGLRRGELPTLKGSAHFTWFTCGTGILRQEGGFVQACMIWKHGRVLVARRGHFIADKTLFRAKSCLACSPIKTELPLFSQLSRTSICPVQLTSTTLSIPSDEKLLGLVGPITPCRLFGKPHTSTTLLPSADFLSPPSMVSIQTE